MTVLLMLTMFVVFLTIDYFMRRGKVTTVETEVEMTATPACLRALSAIVGGFQLPENRRYHQGHTWALEESATLVRVGIGPCQHREPTLVAAWPLRPSTSARGCHSTSFRRCQASRGK
jgi:hypothetical protein